MSMPDEKVSGQVSQEGPSRSQYEEFFNLAEDGIVVHPLLAPKAGGHFVEVNPSICRLLGYSRAEMLTLTPPDVLIEEDRSAVDREIEILHRNDMLRHEKTMLDKDGRRIPVEIVSRRFDKQGRSMVMSIIRDISERKAVEEMLRRYELVARHTRDMILFLRFEDGQILEANEAAAQAYGYRREELLRMTIQDLRADGTRGLTDGQMTLAREEGILFETVHRRKDGRTFPVEVSSQGAMIGGTQTLISVIRDISQRRDTQQQIQSLAKFPEENPFPVLRVSQTGALLYSNAPGLVLVKEWDCQIGEMVPQEWQEQVREVLMSGRYLTREMVSDGRSFSFTLMPVTDGGYVNLYGREITREKQAQEQLRQSELFYRQMLESIPGMVFTTRPDGYCDYQSQQWVEYTGVPMSEHLGEGWNLLLHPDDRPRAYAAWQDAVEGKSPYNLEYRVRRHDGQYEWFKVIGRPIRDAEGGIVRWFGVAANVNELKRAEEALKELNETLEQRVAERTGEVQEKAQQLRGLAIQLSQTEQRERKRLARILHDHIQQLMVAARMQLGWIEHGDNLEQIKSTAHEVSGILTEALEASRSLAIDLSPPVLHESGLTGGLKWLAADLRKKNQFAVHLLADPAAEPASEETRILLFECLREMLLNTIKHAGVSEAEVSLVRTDNAEIQLIVSDRGRGFDPDLLRKRRSDEVSFGLFSIQERLAHIGGRMEIETAPGRGAQITLAVPVDNTEALLEETRGASSSEASDETIHLRRKSEQGRVLIVDDHKIMREGLKRLLRFEADIEVVGEAEDGPQAIELAERLEPDVIIMDVNLGEMSGVEATRRILARRPQSKVIGLSMHADQDVADTLLEAGATVYLTKSGPSEALIEAVRTCAGLAGPSSRAQRG